MNQEYQITIITVCYNSENTIEDTIKSVLSQSRNDWQHVIIDGASTDGTLGIVERYAEQYGHRLCLISEDDNGIYDAMNKGIRNAKGNMIGILNADDYYSSVEVLEHVVSALKKDKKFIYGNLKLIDAAGHVIRRWIPGTGDFKRGWIPPHPTSFIKRDLYDVIGEYDTDFSISADYDLMIRCLSGLSKDDCYHVDEDFVDMRVGGVSNDGMRSVIAGVKQIHRILLKNHVSNPYLVNGLRLIRKVKQYIGK